MNNNELKFLKQLRDQIDEYIGPLADDEEKVENFGTVQLNTYKNLSTPFNRVRVQLGNVEIEVTSNTELLSIMEVAVRQYLQINGINHTSVKSFGRAVLTPTLIDMDAVVVILGTDAVLPRIRVYLDMPTAPRDTVAYGNYRVNSLLIGDNGLGFGDEVIQILNKVTKVNFFGFNGSNFDPIRATSIAELLLEMEPGYYADLRGLAISQELKDMFNQWTKIFK